MADSDTQQAEPEGFADSVKRLSEDLMLLVRKELEIARAEMVEKAKSAGVGAGMLSGSAIAALLTLGSLTAVGILALSLAMASWLAALIAALTWAAAAAVLALAGKKKFADATPLIPEETIRQVKEDVQWAQSGAKSARK